MFDSLDPPKRQRHLAQDWGSCLSGAAFVLLAFFSWVWAWAEHFAPCGEAGLRLAFKLLGLHCWHRAAPSCLCIWGQRKQKPLRPVAWSTCWSRALWNI